MSIWIVNDLLTCIPGTRTFWHLLLEIDGTVDKTGTPYSRLGKVIEEDPGECDLIIRNATFFPPIKRDCKQIAFLQDSYEDNTQQKQVVDAATHTVFNSQYTKNRFGGDGDVIPIGVNQEIFKPMAQWRPDDQIFQRIGRVGIFVGDYNTTKNTRLFEELAKSKSYLHFIYVSKSGHRINLPNVENYAGGVDEQAMARLYNRADFCIYTSPVETLHLTSVEAALCGTPVIGTNTGWLADFHDNEVGIRVDVPNFDNFNKAIDELLENSYSPREYMLTTPYTWDNCKKEWEQLIEKVLNE